MRRGSLAALAAAVTIVVPAGASASTVSVFNNPFGPIKYRSAEGSQSQLSVERGLTFSDPGDPVVAGKGCQQFSGGAACPDLPLEIRLRDLDDRARVIIDRTAEVWAGGGDDSITGDAFGGWTRAHGEGGNDTLWMGGEGGAMADGGGGNDDLRCCGFGGGTMLGGPGVDLLRFATIFPSPVDIDAGSGDDTVTAAPSGDVARAAGGDGADIVVLTPRTSQAGGGYTVDGGSGDDVLVGGPFDDTIEGGDGRDYVETVGGGADTVACGEGRDVARFDASDTVADDCEIRVPIE